VYSLPGVAYPVSHNIVIPESMLVEVKKIKAAPIEATFIFKTEE
jgi:hypothetical protein